MSELGITLYERAQDKLIGKQGESLNASFRFIDLFAGIGGMRIPFDEFGGQCVFTSEIDRHAVKTYQANFPGPHEIFGDLELLDSTLLDVVPDHELVLAGFPCQPFSSAGKRGGFEDARGTLFFSILRIIEFRKPKTILLENVRGLKSHDKGNTYKVILGALQDLGYTVHSKVLNARDFGLPQNRERIFIVAIREDIDNSHYFEFPTATHEREELRLGQILESDPDESLVITDRIWEGHKVRRLRNQSLGRGFSYQIFNEESHYSATLSARYYKDGSEILVETEKGNPRKLSVNEAKLLQGFPEWYEPSISNWQAYKQFGNAVPVPVVRAIAKILLNYL